MPTPSSISAPGSRRLRAASPSVHGGASSLLRLARQGEPRLPSGAALSGWVDRAAAMLDMTPMMVGPQALIAPQVQPAVHALPMFPQARGVLK
jgi:hypothetical protein